MNKMKILNKSNDKIINKIKIKGTILKINTVKCQPHQSVRDKILRG